MLRKANEAVSEGNDPVHQEKEYGFGQPAPVDDFREIKSLLKEQEKMLKELRDDLKDSMRRVIEQYAARLEQDARQPRLAMETDGRADTKTRERTEGAATAVQAMRGDGFSARRVEPGPNNNSTSFGVKAEPPAFPCRGDVVMVEWGDAASESCLPSLEMRSSTAAGGLVPTGEASKAKETNFNQPPLRLCSTEETDHLEAKCKIHGLQFHPPHTTAAASSRRETCLLLPTAGGSLTQNLGKIGLLIQAVHKVTSAPAHVWDRGARWFVARLYELAQLVTSCSVFSQEIRWLVVTRPVLIPCQKKVLPSRAARGYMNWREERRSRRHGDSK